MNKETVSTEAGSVRWVLRKNNTRPMLVLQQLVVVYRTNVETKLEWRDVPVVQDADAGKQHPISEWVIKAMRKITRNKTVEYDVERR